MKEAFVDINFRKSSQDTISMANAIIAEYLSQGYKLTLRQLYYQFVARDLIPNKLSEYKKLAATINRARLAGAIDWDAIEDRTRNIVQFSNDGDPASAIAFMAETYTLDPWLTQPVAVEVWIEKEALMGIIAPICRRYRVPYFASRGYNSQSEMYEAAQRIIYYGKPVKIMCLGDHDPSGIDITRDTLDRLRQLSRRKGVSVNRLALNRDQIDHYQPPPNPAKSTDTRFREYKSRHGDQSWELDALSPDVVAGLIESNIKSHIDADAWNESFEKEKRGRQKLRHVAREFGSNDPDN